MLQRLERADRHAELLALLEIRDGALEELLSPAPCPSAQAAAAPRSIALLDRREGLALAAEEPVGADGDAREAQHRASSGRPSAARVMRSRPSRVAIDHEDRQAGLRRTDRRTAVRADDEDLLGRVAVQHPDLLARRSCPALARSFSALRACSRPGCSGSALSVYANAREVSPSTIGDEESLRAVRPTAELLTGAHRPARPTGSPAPAPGRAPAARG